MVYINGFKYLPRGEDNVISYNVMANLIEGENSVAILSEGDVSGRIRKISTDEDFNDILNWDLDENAPPEVIMTFELEDFEFEWSWMNAEQITEITQNDHAEISQKTNEVISAFEEGEDDLESVLQTHLKYVNLDGALAAGITEEMQREKTLFVYSLMMSPEERLDWINYEGDIVTSISPYNDRLVVITRENNDPLKKYKLAEDKWFELPIYHGIKIEGQWYIY